MSILACTGTSSIGKSTFISDFISKYPKYKTPEKSYRDIPNLDLYEGGTQESQKLIRDFMFKQHQEIWLKRDTNRYTMHDRSLLDNLACTMFLYTKGQMEGTDIISDDFLIESIQMTKKAMSFYHIIYFFPISEKYPVAIRAGIDAEYREAIDTILKTFYNAYANRDFDLGVFPEVDCTSIEEVFGSKQERLDMVGMLLDENGHISGIMDTPSHTPVLFDSKGLEVNTNTAKSQFKLENGMLVDTDEPNLITKW